MKSALLQLRVRDTEKDAFRLAAEASGILLSSWVRERLRRAAIRDLVEVGIQVPFLQRERREDIAGFPVGEMIGDDERQGRKWASSALAESVSK